MSVPNQRFRKGPPDKCQFCPAPLGRVYVTLIGPTEEDTFSICEGCWYHTETDGTGYHPSIHNDGPPK